MKKQIIILLMAAALFFAGSGSLLGSTEASRIFQMPLAEVQSSATDFFQSHDYQVAAIKGGQGLVILEVDRSAVHLQLLLRPHSALATRITVRNDSELPSQVVASLWSHLEKTAAGTDLSEPVTRLPIPVEVYDLADAVVCLYADGGNVDFQASGFVVDRRGLIVTTAHKINKGLKIKAVFRNGQQAPARIIKIDKGKDLALVQAAGAFQGRTVNLAAGRFYLANGEKLVGIVCPKPLTSQFHKGQVDGPPRKAGKQVLWQVRMNVEPGTSGSPVFDRKGRLAGVIKGRFRGTDSIGFVIPFETVLRFLEIY